MKCNRCQKPTKMTFIKHTKIRGKETISLCEDCMQTLLESLLAYGRINFDNLLAWSQRKIGSWEV